MRRHDGPVQRVRLVGRRGQRPARARGLGGLTNQYAAVPSLHVGWALWCGVLLWRHGRHPLLRALGIACPAATALVVMGTANHYFPDAAAGAAVTAAGHAITGRLSARAARRGTARRDVVRWETVRRETVRRGARAAGFRGTAPIVSGGWDTSARELLPAQRPASDDDTAAAAR
ncbi:phosphatase PAP2 family protein [Streptomyces roseus]|uniref:phosphatase PAP2 family protein n=1 Tax=Streptomyces roseus TaxID=66430 RepID=UPI0036941869